MEEDKLNLGVEEIKRIKMTAGEKKHILDTIIASPLTPPSPIQSPFLFASFIPMLVQGRFFVLAVITFLVLGSGSGAVLASQYSLPGDRLYPLKVKVVEPVYSALLISPKSKARHQSALSVKRMVEAEILADEDRLDPSKEEKLNMLLAAHTDSFYKHMNKWNEKKLIIEINNDLITDFRAQMNAHGRVLALVYERELKTEDITSSKIIKTAFDNAGKARESVKIQEEKEPESYNKRKAAVQSIIDSTGTDLDKQKDDPSPERQRIVKDTHRTLSQAQQFLKEADDEDQKGDTKKAYSKLLDSESSAREAGIFLSAGLKLKGKSYAGGNNKQQ